MKEEDYVKEHYCGICLSSDGDKTLYKPEEFGRHTFTKHYGTYTHIAVEPQKFDKLTNSCKEEN